MKRAQPLGDVIKLASGICEAHKLRKITVPPRGLRHEQRNPVLVGFLGG